MYTGLIKRLLSNSTHAQFLVQADHVANDKKGLNLAVLLKRVLLACVIIVQYNYAVYEKNFTYIGHNFAMYICFHLKIFLQKAISIEIVAISTILYMYAMIYGIR